MRTRAEVMATLADDAADRRYRWLWRPMLAATLAKYLWALGAFAIDPAYAADGVLRVNHIGNLVGLTAEPGLVPLGVHLVMANVWIGGTLAQKELAHRMAAADGADWRRLRGVHAAIGTSMCALALVGIAIGVGLAWVDLANPLMQWFLLGQPAVFVPMIAMIAWTARDRERWSIRDHRFWAETGFVATGLAALWAEAAIWALGRHTPIGPRWGDLLGSVAGGGLGFALVAWPAWKARLRGLAADRSR